MNEKLKQQLTEWEISDKYLKNGAKPSDVPYIIYYLSTRFTLGYEKNKNYCNAVLDTENLRLVALKEYGEYLREICLNTKINNRYSNSYSKDVDTVCENLNRYFNTGLLLPVYVDDDILKGFDDFEYKEEFVELLANSSSRTATYGDYEELVFEIENEASFRYKIAKED